MANQYTPDPRQQLFLSYYKDPKSETFSNALQSALKAGYEREYAESITAKGLDWLAESVGDEKLVAEAESRLKEFLLDSFADKRIQADMVKFVLERLNKKKYSTRQEHTGADGNNLEVIIKDYRGND